MWYPELMERIELEVIARSPSPRTTKPHRNRTICCFTGGVDSFYTLINNASIVDNLLFVWGYDIPLTDPERYNEVAGHLRSVSKDFGISLVEVSTNLKEFFEPLELNKYWGGISHGCALAAVGLLLESIYNQFVIPGTFTYANPSPHGSHPLLDPLWSTESLHFIHDGAGATRTEKTETIARSPIVQHNLRVCWQNKSVYNCGKCLKCIRTMIHLETIGELDKYTTFPHEIDLSYVESIPFDKVEFTRFSALKKFVESHGRYDLAQLMQGSLDNYLRATGELTSPAPPTLATPSPVADKQEATKLVELDQVLPDSVESNSKDEELNQLREQLAQLQERNRELESAKYWVFVNKIRQLLNRPSS